DEGAHGGRIARLQPQRRLGAAAQQRNARPVRIVFNERRVAIEAGRAVGIAQNDPFDELLRRGIAIRFRELARLLDAATFYQRDGLLYRHEMRRKRRRAVGGGLGGLRRTLRLFFFGIGFFLGVGFLGFGFLGFGLFGLGLVRRLGRGLVGGSFLGGGLFVGGLLRGSFLRRGLVVRRSVLLLPGKRCIDGCECDNHGRSEQPRECTAPSR